MYISNNREDKMGKSNLLSNIKYVYKSSFKIDKGMFWADICCVPIDFLSMLLELFIPSFFLILFQDDYYNIKQICMGIIVIGIVRIALGLVSNYISSKQYISEHKLVMYYLEKLNKKLMVIDYQKLEDPEIKLVCEKAESSVENNHTEFIHLAQSFVNGIGSILKFVVFCIILTKLAWWLIGILIVTAGIQYLIMLCIDNYEYKTKNSRITILRKLNYIAQLANDYKSAKDIRLYSLHSWLKKYFQELIGQNNYLYSKLTKRKILAAFGDLMIILLRDGGAYFYLGYLTLQGSISPATFVLYFSVISEFVSVLEEIVEAFEMITRGNYQANDYRAFLDMEETNNGSSVIDINASKTIEFQDVCFKFPNSKNDILKSINLKIKSGEKIAIVGLNGAGKTTLIKILCGMYHPSSGKVLIDGICSENIQKKSYFSMFSTVFQEISIFPYSIAENIVYEKRDNLLLDKCCKDANIYSKIVSLKNKYETKLIRNVYEDAVDFSGGEMQKLALARAIYKKSGILVLDEPSAALDPISEEKLYMKYSEFAKNKTSVFISHRLASTRFCDRIILLENGFIVEEGTHQELMNRNGKYANLYLVQSKYYQ